jgi:NAD(P)-dependent dehydrogenase (short-subunit alcohol dehydrogenase family)
MQLVDRRIIVTGAGGGIGAATVRAFAREGARVFALDVDDASAETVAKDAGATFRHCDVSNRKEVNDVFEAATREMGGLDVMANIAGIEPMTPAEDMPEDQWDLVLDVNAKGTALTNQAAFRAMRASGGAIVNYSSQAGVRGQAGSAAYAASKGAVLGWTRTVAYEWGRYGIRVNAIAPVMATPMFEHHRSRLSPEGQAAMDLGLAQSIPLGGKPGDPDADMGPVMVFLASDASRFITGQTLCVDGGLLMLT